MQSEGQHMDKKASTSDKLKTISVSKNYNSGVSSLKLDGKPRRSKSVCKNERELTTAVELGNSSSCPVETVFQIDHILELIALSLDRKTLLNCRFLSNRWAYFGSKALQKIVTIVFTVRQVNHPPVGAEDLVVVKSFHGRSVENLIAVINDSTDFPSTSFKFYNSCGYYNLDNLFNSHGHSVRKYESDGMVTVKEIRQLLLNQAPHLEALLLKRIVIELPVSYPESYYNMKLREAWTQYSIFNKWSTIMKPSFENLQVFECNNQLPEIFVQQILECSPNLVEVSLPEEYLHNLLKPVDRIHLLKELNLGFRFFDFHPLDLVLNKCPDRLVLRRISFNGSHKYQKFPTNAYLGSLDFMLKLLKASAPTCQKLVWRGILKHFEIPCMPQVAHIEFQITITDGWPVSVFEKGVILRDIFPNLKALEIRSEMYATPLVPVGYFFGIYNNEPAPVTSVRNVFMRNFRGPQEYIRNIGQMFPNAFIHGWYITMLPVGNRVK